MFRNLKLGWKLWIGFSALILIVAIIGGVSLFRMASIRRALESIVQDRIERSNLADSTLLISVDNAKVSFQLFVAKEKADLDALGVTNSANSAEITKRVELLQAVIDLPREKELFAKVAELRQPYLDTRRRARELLNQGKHEEAIAVALREMTPALASYRKAWENFTAYERELVDAQVKESAAVYAQGRLIVIGLLGLAIVLGILMAWAITRGVTRQTGALMSLFSRIGLGDYKSRATVYSGDELGTATRAMNSMLDNTLTLIQSSDEKDQIQHSIMRLLDEVGGVAQGDLTNEAAVTSDITGAVADAFNYMILELRKIIGAVQETTLQVSSSANEIQATTEHLAEGTEAQSMQIVSASAAIEEMAVSIQQVSDNAALSATVADEARATAKEGGIAVAKTIRGMANIREKVQETAKRIKRLGEGSQEIGEIVQLIGDIADRTSILALNASIQAAVAGEAGRGFAVVAEEVERLAERSTQATKRIEALIKTIQTETNEVVASMEDNTREVVAGSELANEAGRALDQIQGVSDRLAELIRTISLASKQQARGSEGLAKSMVDIREVTQQTAAGTKQAAVSISQLAGLADMLGGSVRTFKLPHHQAA